MTMENEQVVQLQEQLARVEAERDAFAKRLCICHECGGRGEVHTGEYTNEGHWQPPEPVMVECGECGGDGQIGQVTDLDAAIAQRNTAQAQLAKVLALYQQIRHIVVDNANCDQSGKYHAIDDAFIAVAQAEHQEAQGAQTGDERVAFLVIGIVDYESNEPLAVFIEKPQADVWLAEIEAYQETHPGWWSHDASEEEQDAACKRLDEWRKGHPAGPSASSCDRFCVQEVPLRAALATQPAVGEPVDDYDATVNDIISMLKGTHDEMAFARRLAHAGYRRPYLFAPPAAAAHGDEAVRIDARLLELYQAPFRFDERGGYIWDAKENMVADNHVEGDQAMRVRGWGRLSYRKDGEEVQDLMGQAMADALTARWEAAMRAQAGEGGEV